MLSNSVISGAMAILMTLVPFAVGADVCGAAAGDMTGAPSGEIKGTVVETMNASRYTYVQIDTGKGKIWAAGPMVAVKVGDSVSVGTGMPNKNFYSPTLKRKFEELYFVGAITPSGSSCPVGAVAAPGMPSGAPALKEDVATASTSTAFEAIQKPEGGKTVAEILADKSKLSGKQVVVRGKVVKVVQNVMGMNFLHLRDGTGGKGENDLTVTTKALLSVGQIVTASGVLNTDKDFGSGYKYDVIMENAAVTAK